MFGTSFGIGPSSVPHKEFHCHEMALYIIASFQAIGDRAGRSFRHESCIANACNHGYSRIGLSVPL